VAETLVSILLIYVHWHKIYVVLIVSFYYARTFHLLEFLADPPGPSSIENDADDIEKFLLKTQVGENFLHSEVNHLVQHILV
jgi:hypothetical protein